MYGTVLLQVAYDEVAAMREQLRVYSNRMDAVSKDMQQRDLITQQKHVGGVPCPAAHPNCPRGVLKPLV